MKTKKSFEKKLVLKRRTIATLDQKNLHEAKGGTILSRNCTTGHCTVYISNCGCDTALCY